MKYGILSFLFIGIIVTNLFAQQIATTEDGKKVLLRNDNTWEYIEKSSNNSQALLVQAGVVFQSGEVIPISRTAFYLFEEDAIKTLFTKDTKVAAIADATSNGNKFILLGLKDDHLPTYLSLLGRQNFPKFQASVASIISDKAKYKVITDFKGNASFDDLKSGNYYLFGFSNVRNNLLMWNVEIKIPEQKTIILDQNNMS